MYLLFKTTVIGSFQAKMLRLFFLSGSGVLRVPYAAYNEIKITVLFI